jgi:methylthioribose-1-phosphate isomerase
MKVDGRACRTIWREPGAPAVQVIDQRDLPHRWRVQVLRSHEQACVAIAQMWVRGAPLIGVTAAYGMALQCVADASDEALAHARRLLDSTRPTAVNLAWATRRMHEALLPLAPAQRAAAAWTLADAMAEEDVAVNAAIGEQGLAVLRERAAVRRRDGAALQILTHCNAGWLATVDWGTALAPVYRAHEVGLPLHVWVDETRPRNQGASLTAWELAQAGVPHTVIADNTGGHLMQRGQVDVVLVGADRVSARGDVCNKIGTYLKALAARDNDIPFYVAVPCSTLDLGVDDGVAEIPIEARSPREVTHISGRDAHGRIVEVQLTPDGSPALNLGFDVTPARLVNGLITERGVVAASDVRLLSRVPPAPGTAG